MKKLLPLLALLLAALTLLFSGCVTNEQIQHYNAGVAAYEAGEFEAAKAEFLRTGGYGNSRSYLSAIAEYERIYVEALGFFNERDYDEARRIFDSVSEYENASEYVAYIDGLAALYEEGVAAFEAEDHVTALDCFVRAQGYSDSLDYVTRIERLEDNYQIAMGFYREGNYLESLEAFLRIGVSYKDSEEKMASIYELFSRRSVAPRTLLELFAKSCAAEGEERSIVSAEIGDASFVARTSDGMMIIGNTGEDGLITTVSFWVGKELQKELGEEGLDTLWAHCIHSLTVSETPFEEVTEKLPLYLNGSEHYGEHTISLHRDASGAYVLTADHTPGV